MNLTWAKHEIDFIKKFYSSKGPDYCASSLARPIAGVHRKAHTLGLKCAKPGGFDRSIPGTLYFVSFEVDGTKYYKVGITNQTPEHRLRADWNRLNFKIEWTIKSSNGYLINQLEHQILSNNKKYLVNTKALTNGNTETLSIFVEKPTYKE